MRAYHSTLRQLVVFLCIVTASWAGDAWAGTLAIVSDRSAPALVAGAHQYLQSAPAADVQVRSVSQINALTDDQLQQLIGVHETLLILAVFGEPVERLLAMRLPEVQRRFVLHSDRRLLALHNDSKGKVFAGVEPSTIDDLYNDRPLGKGARNQLEQKQQQWPRFSEWLQAEAYWNNSTPHNAAQLIALLNGKETAALQPVAAVRFALHAQQKSVPLKKEKIAEALVADKPVVWVVDHNNGDRSDYWQLHRQLCGTPKDTPKNTLKWQCVSVLSGWGEPTVEAMHAIVQTMAEKKLAQTPSLVIALQDFVLGGGDGRETVTGLLEKATMPVLKGIRLTEWTHQQWQMSVQGLPTDSVHYRVAMPELQGLIEATVLAAKAPESVDPKTGALLTISQPIENQVARLQQRAQRWLTLQSKKNRDKKVALIYYNHPPGRHNIGADNLDVPASLWHILQTLKEQGYNTGQLPDSPEQLLDLMQAKGVNLPDDAHALQTMAPHIANLPTEQYQQWFQQLPSTIQQEMVSGPLGLLQETLEQQLAHAAEAEAPLQRQSTLELISKKMHNTLTDLHHALDGVRHKGRPRALNLLQQLEQEYQHNIERVRVLEPVNWQRAQELVSALVAMNIEGIRGWGEAPGNVMVWRDQMLIPGLQFGNIFVGPQPPRGWELNEELLHANMSFPPPHQYLGFYYYLRDVFAADALVHIGRHSTYEFLPRRSAGLAEDDYPSVVVGDLPSIYPYIVDGVGEGIQAKRRGMAVMIDHLTPPLAITELYDDLLQLRQLVESAETINDDVLRQRTITQLREQIAKMHLKDELIASMDEELQVRGINFEQVDDQLLLHEVGHYLTNLQEQFMPLGLHTFGQQWSEKAIKTMVTSMADGKPISPQWQHALTASPAAEMNALLNALAGRYVAPGKGNDPIRTPEALPTGRNFYALDGSLLPTRLGFSIGAQLAQQDLQKTEAGSSAGKKAVILWASDAVRDEGAMIAFGMNLLGVEPVWNSRGIIKGLQRIPLSESQPSRQDVVFTTSGLFRDLYGEHLQLLDKAVLLALDASRDTIIQQYPALTPALVAALKPIAQWQQGGAETLEQNRVAAHWVEEARLMLRQDKSLTAEDAGRQASLRIFGTAPGAYGAGINRLVERSDSWQQRQQLGQAYIKRMGHAYGVGADGTSAQTLFRTQLNGISQTYLGRASNLYGLIDNNDAFDYLGGLNLAVETVSGKIPASTVIHHADNDQLRMEPLQQALLGELRGRFLNPQWIKPLMQQDYAGARTMGSEFIEYLWGWQVTSPTLIDSWVWQEVKAIYVDDSLALGLPEFLSEGHNRSVQTNILAVMLVAIDKGFWQADEQTIAQLAQLFSQNIIEHGIPGSGHTHAQHSLYDFVKQQLPEDTAQQLEQVLARSRMSAASVEPQYTHIQEVSLEQEDQSSAKKQEQADKQASAYTPVNIGLWLAALVFIFMAAGFWRGRHVR